MNGLGIQNCCIPSVGAISPMNTAVPGFCPTSSWATPWNNLIPNHNPWLASPFGIAGIGNTLTPGIIPNLPFNTFSPAINTTPFLNTCLPSVWNNAVNPMWNTLAGVPGLGNVSPINAFGLGLNHCMPFGTTVPFIPGCN
jgi:hypothetical protein